jgi:hypothetical protein
MASNPGLSDAILSGLAVSGAPGVGVMGHVGPMKGLK